MCRASISWSQPASTDGQRLVAGADGDLPKQYTPITHRKPPTRTQQSPAQTKLLGVLSLPELIKKQLKIIGNERTGANAVAGFFSFLFFVSSSVSYELCGITPPCSSLENGWYDYAAWLAEKYLTGQSWFPLCQTGFTLSLLATNSGEERETYMFHWPTSRFSLFLSFHFLLFFLSESKTWACLSNERMYNY